MVAAGMSPAAKATQATAESAVPKGKMCGRW